MKIDKKYVLEILKKHQFPKHTDRQRYNLEILEEVKNFLTQHSNMRFIQA